MPVIVSGKNPDGVDHATVWVDGEMVHDPNPKRRGLETFEEVDVLVALYPHGVVAQMEAIDYANRRMLEHLKAMGDARFDRK